MRQPPSPSPPTNIAVIGGGYYGCVTALYLARHGVQVTLFEQKPSLFQGCSGTYGIRLHAGPHYPRSAATRAACQRVFDRFQKEFGQLIAPQGVSLYALGNVDAEGLEARVTEEEFGRVCEEVGGKRVDEGEFGIEGVRGVWKVDERWLYVGKGKEEFGRLLGEKKNVEVVLNHKVERLEELVGKNGVLLDGKRFDWAVNCTYYRAFGTGFVEGVEVVYQPCLTLTYEDLESKPGDIPFMLTVMDGWFPNLTPMVYDKKEGNYLKYKLYHAKYTLLGSYSSYENSEAHVKRVTMEWVQREARPRMELHMETFLPGFRQRFRFTGYLLETATKVKTKSELRRALVFRDGRVIHALSGKLSESLTVADEVVNIVVERKSNGFLDQDVLKEMSAGADENGACDMGIEKWT